MSRTTLRRLAVLEAQQPPARPRRTFQFINKDNDDAAFAAWKAGLIVSGEAEEEDLFIHYRIITPSWQGSR